MQTGTRTGDEARWSGNDRAWSGTLQDALVAGSIVSVVTIATVALRGRSDSGSAVAPINATSHVIYGPEAGDVDGANFRHTLPGLAINAGASVFWAFVYERLFGRTEDRGGVGKSLLGGGAVAGLAYLLDYHLLPKRLTPGWEERISGRSLAMIFAAMALTLPMWSILRRIGNGSASVRDRTRWPGL